MLNGRQLVLKTRLSSWDKGSSPLPSSRKEIIMKDWSWIEWLALAVGLVLGGLVVVLLIF